MSVACDAGVHRWDNDFSKCLTCGKTSAEIVTEFQETVICPWCGYDYGEETSAYAEHGDRPQCARCKKLFSVTTDTTILYSTRRAK